MDITLHIKPATPLDALAMDQLMHWVSVVEGHMPLRQAGGSDAPPMYAGVLGHLTPASGTATFVGGQGSGGEGGAGIVRDLTEDERAVIAESPEVQASIVAENTAAAVPPGAAAPAKRRGRPPSVPPTSPEQAAAAAITADVATAAAAIAIPPTPAAAPSTPAAPPVAAQEPAMPHVPAAAAPTAPGGVMPLDEFRKFLMELNAARSGLPFNVMRAATWQDGTPKTSTMTIEGIPEHERSRIIAECQMALMG